MGISRSIAILACILAPATVLARPISFPDGWMAMTMNDFASYSNSISYSPTAFDAIGVRSDYMREDEVWLTTATYNRLLKRWNTEDSQANIFLQTGAGVASGSGDDSAAASIGIEADWETRRYYLLYENRYVHAGDVMREFSQKARVGIAPYVGGYDDVHTWLMLQVDHRPTDHDNVTITPLVRVFNQDVLGEFGISHRGDVLANITWQF